MTSVLTSIRARLRDLVKAELPAFLDVDLHYGRLQPDEVRKIVMFTPACRVGVFGSVRSEVLPTGELKLLPRFAAVALVKTGDLLESTDASMELATAISATIAAWCPGEAEPSLTGVGLPEAITVEPSPASVLEAEGIALWGCLFTVPVVIGRNLAKEDAEAIVELTNLDQYFPMPEDEAP